MMMTVFVAAATAVTVAVMILDVLKWKYAKCSEAWKTGNCGYLKNDGMLMATVISTGMEGHEIFGPYCPNFNRISV
ncbi:unnamed protein product [Nippostrongylus brasiliensis]|uniref:Secreted protein n=1 Tax=Nippostrongylus brasiliensis TaxID=27835 RepID=A0A0N4YSX1_NIPBR|nr:unnamed protein product [Nippostrongylus brasiliensis]